MVDPVDAPARHLPAAAFAPAVPPAAPPPATASRRRLLTLAALPLAAWLPAACTTAPFATPAAPPPERPGAPRVRVGERWRYAQIDVYSGARQAEIACEVIELAPRLRVRLTDSRGTPRPDEIYADAWRVLQEPFYDFLQVFEQPVPLLPDVLAAGESSRLDTSYGVPQTPGERYAWQQRLHAAQWERVRVPAGEFDALRIERYIRLDHPDPRRLYPVRRDRLWYAPAVNRWVRREWTGEYRGPGARRGAPMREDWVAWELLEHLATPVS